jgi:hypothetical protein
LGETNSVANFSLAVLMNSVKRCMTALFASIVIGHPHRTRISRQHNSSQVLINAVTGHVPIREFSLNFYLSGSTLPRPYYV